MGRLKKGHRAPSVEVNGKEEAPPCAEHLGFPSTSLAIGKDCSHHLAAGEIEAPGRDCEFTMMIQFHRTGPRPGRNPASQPGAGSSSVIGHRQWCAGAGLSLFLNMTIQCSEIREPADN